ncbi:alginate export family protein [Spongiibacter nanhainus]|uniref:Alginate export family protein n=1 Tax=Spongiibacter nanhainus TaxID=2794344 RepID=A0A7T4R494_9GAMM|nr:alginate export family protein [Spongiibacter nanhainus]QQD19984.1 alginate export family protein [Spongiibacter nanhainus]
MNLSRLPLVALIAVLCTVAPWTNAVTTELSGRFRIKAEGVTDVVAAGRQGSDQLGLTRLLLKGSINEGNWGATAELLDARSWLDDASTPIGNSDVNTLEPLQAYISWRSKGDAGEMRQISAGRMTADFMSRRLLSRSNDSNAPHSFVGVYSQLNHTDRSFDAFFLYPMRRRPSDRNAIDNNERSLDRRLEHTHLWGLGLEQALEASTLRGYVLGLNEDDEHRNATRQRELVNLGVQWLRKPETGQLDHDIDIVYQHGKSKLSSSDPTRLDHRAWMATLHSGYQYADRGFNRVFFNLDYASGDQSPSDGENNRFDRLYGSTSSDFGPPARVYGAFTRENIITPWLGLSFRYPRVNGFIAYREIFLADDSDRLRGAKLQDSTGSSGRHAGSQLEARLRASPTDSIKLQFGAAYLIRQRFMEDAPGAQGYDNSFAGYGQIEFFF